MPAEWGQAKIEILALQDEILAEIEKGISARQIFDNLSAAKRITISRRSFYRRVKLLRAERSAPKTTARTQLQSSQVSNPARRPNNTPISSTLPTLKAEEQAEFNRLWDAPSDDGEDTQ
ncbi:MULTISPECIES: hypothetical protein [Pseudomonadota]|uniref:hypothetical protein n=1 Tax=Pseudomonadota TaxID=1224 RepID=UPI003A953AED